MEFDQNDLKVERKNGMFLSNNQIKTLKKNNIDYDNYDSLESLIFELNNVLIEEEDDELESLAIDLAEFNYYNNQNK
ncbi:MAG: hypothetical protein ACI4XR_06005 [Bacilli bacterium]